MVGTSFYPLYYFASEIGGEKATVYTITPAGTEPHDYEPTPQDMVRIQKSDLLILNGGAFEPWGEAVAKELDNQKIIIIKAGDSLATQTIQEDGEEIIDPHIWLNPLLAQKQVEQITQGFIQADPLQSAFYQSRALQLTTKLDILHKKYQDGLAHCEKKSIITSHAAFGYIAKQYGLQQVPISGLSPDEEPSAQRLAYLTNFAQQNKIEYIFFESLVSPKLSQTLANELGAKTLVFNPLEGLTTEELQQGKNYFTVMEENLNHLRIALSCQ
jgi:zinc transport system substrate-binding protein